MGQKISKIVRELLRDGDPPEIRTVTALTPAGPSLKGLKILVVDDQLAGEIEEWLKPYEAKVTATSSAAEGYEAYQQARGAYDVVLLDLSMPVEGGRTLHERLKNLAEQLGVLLTVIFITAHAEQFPEVSAFNHGAVDYIVKPFDGEQLAQRIQEAVA